MKKTRDDTFLNVYQQLPLCILWYRPCSWDNLISTCWPIMVWLEINYTCFIHFLLLPNTINSALVDSQGFNNSTHMYVPACSKPDDLISRFPPTLMSNAYWSYVRCRHSWLSHKTSIHLLRWRYYCSLERTRFQQIPSHSVV